VLVRPLRSIDLDIQATLLPFGYNAGGVPS
jgi:hypothetical protein